MCLRTTRSVYESQCCSDHYPVIFMYDLGTKMSQTWRRGGVGLGVGKHLKLTATGNGFLGEQGKVTEKHQDRHFIFTFVRIYLKIVIT